VSPRTWAAIVAEAWALARRRVAVTFVVGAVVMGAGSCGTAQSEIPPPPASTTGSVR
jgi:hypothetical protein